MTPANLVAGNLFAGIPAAPPPGELFATLVAGPWGRVERIVSWGHAAPVGEWYDQAADEWVVLVAGAAHLRIEGRPELLEMRPGDWVFLPARLRHRVEWTDPAAPTVWLAVHPAKGGP